MLGPLGGSGSPGEVVEEKRPLGLLLDDNQSLSGTGDRTGFVGETGLMIGGMGWKVLFRPVEEVRGGIAFGEGNESLFETKSTSATIL